MKKTILAICCFLFLYVSCGVREMEFSPSVSLGLATAYPPDHPLTSALNDFSRLCRDRSRNTLNITIVTSGKLGDDALLLTQIQCGDLDMACVSAFSLASYSPYFFIFSLPLIFRDTAHFRRVIDGDMGIEALDSLASRKLIGLGHFDSGAIYFVSRLPALNAPADFRGKRAALLPGPAGAAFIKALGASPLSLPQKNNLAALNSGLVDIAASDLFLIKHNQTMKPASFIPFPILHSPAVLVIGEKTMARLPPDTREFLTQNCREAFLNSRSSVDSLETETITSLRQAGLHLSSPSHEKDFQVMAAKTNILLSKGKLNLFATLQKQ